MSWRYRRYVKGALQHARAAEKERFWSLAEACYERALILARPYPRQQGRILLRQALSLGRQKRYEEARRFTLRATRLFLTNRPIKSTPENRS